MNAFVQSYPNLVGAFAVFGAICFAIVLLIVLFFAWAQSATAGPSKEEDEEEAALDIYYLLPQLTEAEGDMVTILSENAAADKLDEQRGVEVTAHWTQYNTHRFFGATIRDALRAALEEKNRIKSTIHQA
jgi:hypothetical protein